MSKRGPGDGEQPLREASSSGRPGCPAKGLSGASTATVDRNLHGHGTQSFEVVKQAPDRSPLLAEPVKNALRESPSQSKALTESSPRTFFRENAFPEQRGVPATEHEKADRSLSSPTNRAKPVTSGAHVARKPAEHVQAKPPVLGDTLKRSPQSGHSRYIELPKPKLTTGIAKNESVDDRHVRGGEDDFVRRDPVNLAAPRIGNTPELSAAECDSRVPKLLQPAENISPVHGEHVKSSSPGSSTVDDGLAKRRRAAGSRKDDYRGERDRPAGKKAPGGAGSLEAAATSVPTEASGIGRNTTVPKLFKPTANAPLVFGEPVQRMESQSSFSRDNGLPNARHSPSTRRNDSPHRQALPAGMDVLSYPGSVDRVASATSGICDVCEADRGSHLPKPLEPATYTSSDLGQPVAKVTRSSNPRDNRVSEEARGPVGVPESHSIDEQCLSTIRPESAHLTAPMSSAVQLPGIEQRLQGPKLLQPPVVVTPVLGDAAKSTSQGSVVQSKGILKQGRSPAFPKNDGLCQQGPVITSPGRAAAPQLRSADQAEPAPSGKYHQGDSPWSTDQLSTSLTASHAPVVSKSKRVSIDPRTSVDVITPTETPSGPVTPPQSASSVDWSSPPWELPRRLSDTQTKSSSIQPHFWSGKNGEQNPAAIDSSSSGPWIRRQALAVRRAVMSRPPWSSSPGRHRFRAVPHIKLPPVKGLLRAQAPTMPPTTPAGSLGSSVPSWSSWVKHRFPRLVLAAVVVAMVAMLLLFVAHRAHNDAVADRLVCSTDDCVQYARRILRRMNTSANPCYDFHAYVCGGVGGSPGTPSHTNGPQRVTIARQQGRELVSALNYSATGTSQAHKSDAAFKALRALETCLERRSADAAGQFAVFMRERGIPWPASADAIVKHVDVLDIILQLVIDWRATLWFDVRLEYHGLDGNPVIVVGEASALALYRMEQLSDLDDNAYKETVRAVAAFLTGGAATLTDHDVDQLLADEAPIRRALLAPEEPDDYDSLMPMHELYERIGGISFLNVTEWLAFLDKHMHVNLSTSTLVLLIHERRCLSLADTFANMMPSRLLNVIGWTLAYVYAWTVNPALDALGATTDDHLTANDLCFLAVHESYGIAQVAPFFLDAFPTEERVSVESVITRTAEALMGILRSSGRLTNATLAQATVKIAEQSAVHPWPLKALLRLEILDLLYSEFPLETDSFFATWLESRKALRNSLHNRYYATFMLARYRWRYTRVQYLYSLNLLRLGLGVVFPPSYLRHGCATMTYAGLGFQLARQLVRIVDERGRTLDYDGRPYSWWNENTGHPKCRLSTATSPTEQRAVADLFALDVAYAAMEEATRRSTSPLRLKLLDYCSHYCDSQPLLRARSMCDLAIDGSRFGTAFGCEAPAGGARQCLFV
ncbi:hypothetical protein MTO96_048090 [Rhipicephalus appendiculatus]